MSYGELPATGLYVVLSIVVVFAAILTTQIADVRKRKGEARKRKRKARKRESRDWKNDAVRLKRFATGLLWIAKLGAIQMAVVLLFAAWEAYRARPDGDWHVSWWGTTHTVMHLVVVVALLVFLVRWFRAMERNPESPY